MNNELIDQETKKVLRGYCIKPIHSVNLDKETLYYLEPHGIGCYFVSRFPSGKRSHMGVYQKERFHVIRAEVVTISNTDGNISKRESEIAINADVKETKKEHVNLKRVAKEKYLVWDDLKCDVIYNANLVYDPNGNTLPGPVQQYYVRKMSKGEPYYNELSCSYYEDRELSILKGGGSIKRFENFVEVGPAPVTKKTTGNKQTLSNDKIIKHEYKSEDTEVLVGNQLVNATNPTVPVKDVREEANIIEIKNSEISILPKIEEKKVKRSSKKKDANGEQITFDLF
ncbi:MULTISPECIES: hypothetical protein [Bacillati]|uniref:hypothetical protein n=1 Tax=Bacillati TaxID=1783272 RepID=UPI003439A268